MSYTRVVQDLTGLEERQNGTGDPSWDQLKARGWGNASPRAAEGISAIFACVDVISSALSSLPVQLFGRDRKVVTDHPAQRFFDEGPNPWQTWPDFVSWLIAEALLFGNGVGIVLDGDIWPSRWAATGTQTLPGGVVRYDYQIGDGNYNRHGSALSHSVLHLRDRSDDGIVGRSRLSRCAATIGLAHDTLDAAVATWRNGALPSGAIKLPGRVPPEERARLRSQIETQFAGATNRSRILLLDGGSEWEALSSDLKDSEALETRRFMVAEIARVFQVPPPMLQAYENNTFTNSQEATRWFARFTLGSWARRLEAEFNRRLLRDGVTMALDMSAFTRADHKDRWDAYKVALETKVLTAEDVRRLEGF